MASVQLFDNGEKYTFAVGVFIWKFYSFMKTLGALK